MKIFGGLVLFAVGVVILSLGSLIGTIFLCGGILLATDSITGQQPRLLKK